MAKPIDEIDRELDARVEALGMELVDVEWAGRDIRPVLRLRIDLPGAEPGRGVTVADCARASRALEAWLDEHPAVPERYVLEVSSPGVERPLRRERDFVRFAGQEVRIRRSADADEGPEEREIQGTLAGVEDGGDGGYDVVLQLPDGEKARIPERSILRANLVFRWQDED